MKIPTVPYEPFAKDQAKILYDMWPDDARWFIVGGTADANEAQTIKARFPDVRCLGCEPNPELYRRQRDLLQFPGALLECALWSKQEVRLLTMPRITGPLEAELRSASLCRPEDSPDLGRFEPASVVPVQCYPLDYLSEVNGPFEKAVLWIDVEYAELEVLKGARRLLDERKILLINLETFLHLQPAIDKYLAQYGIEFVMRWNERPDNPRSGYDAIYRLRSK